MACVTLKRPLEWIDPSMSAEPSGSSSPTSMIISNSPPHSGSIRSPKRLCLQGAGVVGNGYSSPISSYSSYMHHQSSSSSSAQTNHHQLHSNNTYFKPISSAEIAEQIREEMLRLRVIRNRHNASSIACSGSNTGVTSAVSKAHNANSQASGDTSNTVTGACNQPSKGHAASNNKNDATSATTVDDNIGNKSPSPSESSMGSCSPSSSPCRSQLVDLDEPVVSTSDTGSNSYNLYTSMLSQRHSNDKSKLVSSSSSSSNSTATTSSNNKVDCNKLSFFNRRNSSGGSHNLPLFTFNQVVMIVERLLRQKEESIRREYETVLSARLAEQYEQFVKFSFDQIQRRFDSQALPSYLS